MPRRTLTDPYIRGLEAPDKRIEIYDQNKNGQPTGLVLRLSTAGGKSFVYRYRYGKDVKRITIGRYPKMKLAAARKKVGEIENMLSNGLDPLVEKKRNKEAPKPTTIQQLSELFIEKHLPTLKQSTQDDYKRRIQNVIQPEVGGLYLEEINRADIVSFLEDIDAPIQSNRVRAILSSMLSFAVQRGMIEYNPVQGIKPLGKETQRDRVYNNQEIKTLWGKFEEEAEPFRSVLKMLLICGQRAGETRMAKWEHIKKDEVWHIPAGNTKANREQNLPLPQLALDVLNDIKSETGHTDFIFASPREKNEPIAWLQNAAKRVRDNCAVKDFRLHDLRRTVASNLARLGFDRTVIGKTLNHKGLARDSMVTAVYDRYDYLDEKKAALEAWSKELQSILK